MSAASILRESRIAEARRGFAARLTQHSAEIEAILASGSADLGRLGEIAHRLHGTGGSFGFEALARASAVLEDRIKASAPAQNVKASARKVLTELSAIQAEVR
jgi:HPt (histidine-containing phosphotransfer) domain-containing protein